MKKRSIYTLKMAQALINQGFKPIAQVPSAKDLTRNVWIFEETDEFKQAFEKYLEDSGFQVKPESSNVVKFSRRLISRMYFKQGLPVKTIARITGKSETQIEKVIDKQVDLYRLFAIAEMNTEELTAYAAIQDEQERTKMAIDFLKQKKLHVYGGKDSYNFPDDLIDQGGE